MKNIAAIPNDHDSPVLTAPDGSTTFRASSIPTARQIADWCHPRGNPDRWMQDWVATPVASVAVEAPPVALLLNHNEFVRPDLPSVLAVTAAVVAVRRTSNVGLALGVGLPMYWFATLAMTASGFA